MDVARLLQIEPLLRRRPSQLSGGQRQRVAMGRALVRNPDVFLFDEPLSNLDAKLRVDMRTEIKKLHQKLGTTMIYVTHDQIEAMTLSTRIVVMNHGLVQQFGTPREIYDTPANMFVAGFMGSPSMNLIAARLVKNDGALNFEIMDAEGTPQLLRIDRPSPGLERFLGNDVVLGIRPEAISDIEGADRNARNIQTLRNRVSVIEPAGSDTFVTTRIAERDCIARLRADAEVRQGEEFPFAFNMDKAIAFDANTDLLID